MDKFKIIGGKTLRGTVTISGAKNSALPCLAATLLTADTVTLRNVPYVRDLITMRRLLEDLGATALVPELRTHRINAGTVEHFEAPYELVKTMRASVLALGPLVARFGQARVSLPGGCAIGSRPIDLHLMALEKLGAKVEMHNGVVVATADQLKGADIAFETVTVTGTENLLMAAVLAKGTTRIFNAACEPEVTDLIGEITNMVSGDMKRRTAELGYNGLLAPPLIMQGDNIVVESKDAPISADNIFRIPELNEELRVRVFAKLEP